MDESSDENIILNSEVMISDTTQLQEFEVTEKPRKSKKKRKDASRGKQSPEDLSDNITDENVQCYSRFFI